MKYSDSHMLFDNKPAKAWQEAYPLGNGSLGAMIFGDTREERFSLNLDTLWTGVPFGERPLKNSVDFLIKAREAAMMRDYHLTQKYIEDGFFCFDSDSYQPMGELYFTFHHNEIKNYRRHLFLDTALHTVSYKQGENHYVQETLISNPDKTLVSRIETEGEERLTFGICLTSQLRHNVQIDGTKLLLDGECMSSRPLHQQEREHYYSDPTERGICFRTCLGVVTDGCLSEEFDEARSEPMLEVTNATYAEIYLTSESSFNGYDKHPFLEGKEYKNAALQTMEAAIRKGYECVKRDHIADHKKYYDRVTLDLGSAEKSETPTALRLSDKEKGGSDPALYSLFFNFGRYLTIASSREGCQPPNLQGIWNDMIDPPWRCNYTTNINLQMNYFPTLSCDLPELCEPLTRMTMELAEVGSVTANQMYGARGWVVNHNTDIWRKTTPSLRHIMWSYFPNCQGWLCHHLYDYYEYTLDKDFLQNTALPLMRGAAEFYLDMLSEDKDGYLIMSPSTSPENTFLYEGKICEISQTSTMSISFIKELFENILSASRILNISDALTDEIAEKLPRLLPFRTSASGSLLEYYEDHEQIEWHHRHVSHLYALHPARLITPEKTPELIEACKKTLEERGDDGTGWGLAWKINFFARLRDGNHAKKLLDLLLRPVAPDATGFGGTYPNLLDAHPPFQIDGNFGAASGISEMLLQSGDGYVFLLPALPDDWANGEVKGLCARGNVKIDIAWQDSKLLSCTAHGNTDGLRFIYNGQDITKNISSQNLHQ